MQNTISSKVDQVTVIGLVGFYFKDTAFKDLMFIQVGEKSNLMDKSRIDTVSQQIHSVRWMGNLIPPQTGVYKLSTSFNTNVIMQINGETVINQSNIEKSLQLEKDKLYEIKIEYRDTADTLSDLQLFWSIGDAKREQIPEKYIISPNFSEKENVLAEKEATPFFPEYNLFDRQQENGQKQSISAPIDSDNDGIPDEWEEKGYTFKDNRIVAWDDSFSEEGYKKYVSNPNSNRTAKDPYTDFEKVTGHMPAATRDEARDPLVAAYPAVGVGMEKLLFSKNADVSEGASGTKSKSVTKTETNTKTVELGAEFGFDKDGFSFSFSPKYTESWSNSTSVENTESESWSKQININLAESAYLNANVRYYNAGTAPIYALQPTSNFVLQNSGKSITTIIAGTNQIGNSLGPGDTYPKKEQAPISLDKANEAGSVKITINAEQLDELQNGTETLNLETTQNKGQYATLNETGVPVTDPSKQWDPIRTDIDAISGSLTLNLGTGKESLERRVAAKNVNDPEDKTPEITIKEAIKKAFDAKEKASRLYYKDRNGKDICIDESAINLIGDENTKKEIEIQLSQMQDKKIYNAKWKRGMKITLHIPTAYYDFESESDWCDTSYGTGEGYSGTRYGDIGTTGNGWANLPPLKPYTSYTARAYMRTASATGNNDVEFYVSNNSVAGQGVRVSGKVLGNQWKLVEISFNTFASPEYFKSIGFKNTGNANLHFDDVSVTEWKTNEDIQKRHVFGAWFTAGSIVMGGVFNRVPSTTVRYQWNINGNLGSILPAIPADNNGKRIVLSSQPFTPNDSAELYAIDEHNDNLKVKVVEHVPLGTGHEVDRWNAGDKYINGMTFKKVPNRELRYQLAIDGKFTSIMPAGATDAQGRRYINFLEFNSGYGISIFKRIEVYAVDDKINDLRVLVAKHSIFG